MPEIGQVLKKFIGTNMLVEHVHHVRHPLVEGAPIAALGVDDGTTAQIMATSDLTTAVDGATGAATL